MQLYSWQEVRSRPTGWTSYSCCGVVAVAALGLSDHDFLVVQENNGAACRQRRRTPPAARLVRRPLARAQVSLGLVIHHPGCSATWSSDHLLSCSCAGPRITRVPGKAQRRLGSSETLPKGELATAKSEPAPH